MTKKKNKNLLVMIVAILLMVGVSVGYSALRSVFQINGNTTINNVAWDIEEKPEIGGDVPGLEDNGEVTVADDGLVSFTANLKQPGDTFSFTATYNNNGTLDGKIESITNTELTTRQAEYLEYTVKYQDGSTPAENDLLEHGKSVTFVVTVKYRNDIEKDKLPTAEEAAVPFASTLKVNYVQA